MKKSIDSTKNKMIKSKSAASTPQPPSQPTTSPAKRVCVGEDEQRSGFPAAPVATNDEPSEAGRRWGGRTTELAKSRACEALRHSAVREDEVYLVN